MIKVLPKCTFSHRELTKSCLDGGDHTEGAQIRDVDGFLSSAAARWVHQDATEGILMRELARVVRENPSAATCWGGRNRVRNLYRGPFYDVAEGV